MAPTPSAAWTGGAQRLRLSQAMKVISVSAVTEGVFTMCAETASFFCGLHSPKHKTPQT